MVSSAQPLSEVQLRILIEMGDGMKHPYSPEDLQLPGYVPIFFTPTYILIVYTAASSLLFLFTWILSGRCLKITTVDRFLMCWWAFTGLTHIVLGGYFILTPDFYKVKSPVYLAEVLKEYSKGDSRYVARNSSVVTLEGITTLFGGPASLLAMYAIGARKPYSYLIQFSVSLSQLYGDIVYFFTAFLDGDNFSASQYYYWAYFVFANSFWVVIPMLISVRCWRKITQRILTEKMKKV